MADIYLFPADGGRSAYDVLLRRGAARDALFRLRPRDESRGAHDVQLYPAQRLELEAASGASFPTQYAGLRCYFHSTVNDLCLVATADAPAGMGAVPRIRKGGVDYAIYLVDTTDPNASPVRLRTSAGTKAIRIKT